MLTLISEQIGIPSPNGEGWGVANSPSGEGWGGAFLFFVKLMKQTPLDFT